MRLRFKQVCEERRMVRFARKLVGGVPRMMVKVYIFYDSANPDSTWKTADRYFLTIPEYEAVHQLLLTSNPGLAAATNPDSCCICLENCIERRLPECRVSTRQHGFCTGCISLWLDQNDTCPMCRSQIPGQNGRSRVEVLQSTLRFIPSEQVQAALRLIMHSA